jgi:hypothetical protein
MNVNSCREAVNISEKFLIQKSLQNLAQTKLYPLFATSLLCFGSKHVHCTVQ